MITGKELRLFGGLETTNHNVNPGHAADSSVCDESNIYYFIQRILKRTQLSCTTLILALIYIDRFKTRIAQAMKRRTRLDQGPDYDQTPSLETTPLLNETSMDDKEIPLDSTPPLSLSSNSHSPSSTLSILSHQSNGGGNNNNSRNKRKQESWSSISLFLVSVICADKYLYDATFSNAEWADFTRGQYTTAELNDLERRFLGHLQYRLYVSEPEFDGFLSYLEVILALNQVWGRGLITFSYSDVRILTQRLTPAYAGRLQFKALQGDMIAIVWQVMAAFSRMYLAIVGTIIVAAVGYKAIAELSQAVLSSATFPNSHGMDLTYDSLVSFIPTNIASVPPLSCTGNRAPAAVASSLSHGDDETHHIVMDWAFAQSTIVQCAA
ncbi:Cyclin-dependent protein kinase [Entomortierella chlamydospora]|uniref:Cyclin-dependent protein kinase n=1 Tax=Entomortierella chlamydospora TaxID=101097 RepID=A0A9P6T160_9FUNG|nr:Cyclin-dependent protein kinase [Entomortierella chlamydospora]KAG0017604.1 Cyclin-dependent protein kinase [Entomortierella chlamydospora]